MDEKYLEEMWKIMKEHNLELTDDTGLRYECTICEKIAINACTAPCRCLFCLDCIKQYLKDNKLKCPGQSECCDIDEIDFISDIQVNRVINKRISKLRVKCPNVGCQSQVELNVIGDHLRTCENQPISCPYLIIGCEGVTLRNDQMSEHLSMEIHPHTKLLINWVRNSQNETKFMKRDLDKLREGMRTLSKDNDELKAQMRAEKEHTGQIIRELQRKEKENSTEIEVLNEEICALKNSDRSMKEKLKKLKNKNEHQISLVKVQVENRFEDLKEKSKLTESNCGEILCQSKRNKEVEMKVNQISQTLDSIQTETRVSSKSMENIRELIDETISGQFHWTIDKWAERLKSAQNRSEVEIFSASFFTHRKGYKFCLSAEHNFVNGNLWVFGHLMRGPFDDLLQWPFDRDLQLALINPESELPYKIETERCSCLDADDCRLQKPKSERNPPILIFRFPLQELSSKTELSLVNRIWMQLSVKPASITIEMK